MNSKIINPNIARAIPSGNTEEVIPKTEVANDDGEAYKVPYKLVILLFFIISLKIVIKAPANEIIRIIPGINQENLGKYSNEGVEFERPKPRVL